MYRLRLSDWLQGLAFRVSGSVSSASQYRGSRRVIVTKVSIAAGSATVKFIAVHIHTQSRAITETVVALTTSNLRSYGHSECSLRRQLETDKRPRLRTLPVLLVASSQPTERGRRKLMQSVGVGPQPVENFGRGMRCDRPRFRHVGLSFNA